MENSIVFKNVSKSYGKVNVLDNISFSIEEGKIYGLIGRNGAGKTTILNLIADRIFKESGEVKIFNEDVHENEKALRKIYFMSENIYMIKSMKVKEFFYWMSKFYKNFDINYAKELCKKFDLDINKKFGSLSTGYKTIYKIIGALASNAEIIIYDEPVLGLDVNHRELFYKELLKSYDKNENTIIISTHLIEEVSGIIEKAILINKGNIILDGYVDEILFKSFKISGESRAVEEFIENKNVISKENFNGITKAVIYDEIEEKAISEIKIEKIKLQDLYLSFTNR